MSLRSNVAKGRFRPMLSAFALLLLIGASARAEGIKDELKAAAERIGDYMKDKHPGSPVAVGVFSGSIPKVPTSSGPAIQKALSELLQEMDVKVDDGATLEVKGDYFSGKDPVSGLPAVIVNVRLVDRGTGEELLPSLKSPLLSDLAKASILGPVATLPADGGSKARAQALEQGIKAPKPAVKQTKVSAGPKSPYAIEVLVKSGDKYVERPIELKGGFPYISLKKDEIYAIRIINDSGYDAAVVLTIDGLNMFTFSENKAYKELGKVIVPTGRTLLKGWHLTDSKTSQFLATAYAKSAAAELNSASSIGTITVSFARAWSEGSTPPDDEPLTRNAAEATARGPVANVKYVAAKRFFGVTRETVSIRYAK